MPMAAQFSQWIKSKGSIGYSPWSRHCSKALGRTGGRQMADKKKRQGEKGNSADASHIGSVALPLEWHFPDDLVGRYANQLIVQMGPMECNLSFFEVRPPVIVGTPEQMQEQAKKLTSIRAECVARIVAAPESIPMFISLLQEVWTKHQAKQLVSDKTSDKVNNDSQGNDEINGKT
jgi:hypothetical protein